MADDDDLFARLKAYEGRPATLAGTGKDPVNLPMIRHWCEALGDTNPAYTGPGAVAPPTMLQAWTMAGLSGPKAPAHPGFHASAVLGPSAPGVPGPDVPAVPGPSAPAAPGSGPAASAPARSAGSAASAPGRSAGSAASAPGRSAGSAASAPGRPAGPATSAPAPDPAAPGSGPASAPARSAGSAASAPARPSGPPDRTPAYDELLGMLDEAGCTSVVATDCEQEYLRPLRPGDEITFDTVIESVSPRKTTKLGTGYFVTTRTRVHAAGELAGTHRFRILKYAPAQRQRTPAETRPRPVVSRDNAGFWEGVRRHELLIQRCTGCRTLRFPWLPGCAACGGLDWDTVRAAGDGTVHSYVVMHHPPFPAFGPPYAVGLVELAEGVRIVSNVVGVPYDKVRIGMRVRLEFRRYDDELVLPVFRGGLS
ncbi:OB-fold domain-containing protein [Streptomyces sp. NPDC059861]|uniref:OB-fold domain-containing protein n=1 Tax=Streptomyces sp. NPDC059861 TaxID=3346974 RepID=UPI00365023A9